MRRVEVGNNQVWTILSTAEDVWSHQEKPAVLGSRAGFEVVWVRGLRADVEAGVAADGEGVTDLFADGCDVLLDACFVVLDERLVDEAGLGEELIDFTDEDLVDDLGRLAFGFELLAVDLVLFLDGRGIEIVAGQASRVKCGDVQANVACKALEGLVRGGVCIFSTEFKQNAYFATHVDVGGDGAIAVEVVASDLLHLDDLTELGEFRAECVLHGAVLERERGSSLSVRGIGCGDRAGDVGDKCAEAFVLGHEVGLAVDFNEHAGVARIGDVGGDQALGCLAVGATSRLNDTFFTEDFNSGVEVTIGFGEGFFTSHHAGVGDFAELLNSRCGDHFK